MKWFVGLLIFVLCVFDAGITVYMIECGLAYEINPVMLWWLGRFGVAGLLLLKVILASIASFFVVGFWNKFRTAKIGGFLVAGVYLILFIYHIVGISSF